MMGLTNYQDFCTHLHLAGVYTVQPLRAPVTKEGRFQGWTRVPPTVSVILVVPRSKIRVLSDMDPNKVGTPVLHGNLLGQNAHNIFASLKVGFGKVTPSGTDARPGGDLRARSVFLGWNIPPHCLILGPVMGVTPRTPGRHDCLSRPPFDPPNMRAVYAEAGHVPYDLLCSADGSLSSLRGPG
jgi:hypothetical protein